jgi:predicted alpha/beta hydrolase family esterase
MNIATLREKLESFEVLVQPGWRNSGPMHWQSRWQQLFPEFRRVEQQNWVLPRRQDWVTTLAQQIDAATKPVILIAHSLGCATVAHLATGQDSVTASGILPRAALTPPSTTIAAALLVAPADVERATVASSLRSFAPLSRKTLPFKTLLVGSDNDPCCTAWRAAEMAESWGADFQVLSGVGHINADSNLGDWLEGLDFLAGLLPETFTFSAAKPTRPGCAPECFNADAPANRSPAAAGSARPFE